MMRWHDVCLHLLKYPSKCLLQRFSGRLFEKNKDVTVIDLAGDSGDTVT